MPKQRERTVSIKVTTLAGIISIKRGEFIPLNLIHRKQHSKEAAGSVPTCKPYENPIKEHQEAHLPAEEPSALQGLPVSMDAGLSPDRLRLGSQHWLPCGQAPRHDAGKNTLEMSLYLLCFYLSTAHCGAHCALNAPTPDPTKSAAVCAVVILCSAFPACWQAWHKMPQRGWKPAGAFQTSRTQSTGIAQSNSLQARHSIVFLVKGREGLQQEQSNSIPGKIEQFTANAGQSVVSAVLSQSKHL